MSRAAVVLYSHPERALDSLPLDYSDMRLNASHVLAEVIPDAVYGYNDGEVVYSTANPEEWDQLAPEEALDRPGLVYRASHGWSIAETRLCGRAIVRATERYRQGLEQSPRTPQGFTLWLPRFFVPRDPLAQ